MQGRKINFLKLLHSIIRGSSIARRGLGKNFFVRNIFLVSARTSCWPGDHWDLNTAWL
jgi:hypothetical protein